MMRIILFLILVIIWSVVVWATEINEQVDSLFIIASSGELKYREMVDPAIDSIAALSADAVPGLIEKYDTKNARERFTINKILEKIGKPATPYLLDALSDDDMQKVSRICYTLGNIKDSTAVDGLINISSKDDWRVRSSAAGALGKIGDNRADEAIIKLLSDPDESVRKSSVVSAGKLLIENAIPMLVHLMGDEFYGARLAASEALAKFDKNLVIPIIADSLSSSSEILGNLGCTTLGLIGGDSSAAVVSTQLNSKSSIRRTLAVEAIFNSNSSIACGAVELLKETEKDHTVIYYINQVLEKYASR